MFVPRRWHFREKCILTTGTRVLVLLLFDMLVFLILFSLTFQPSCSSPQSRAGIWDGLGTVVEKDAWEAPLVDSGAQRTQQIKPTCAFCASFGFEVDRGGSSGSLGGRGIHGSLASTRGLPLRPVLCVSLISFYGGDIAMRTLD